MQRLAAGHRTAGDELTSGVWAITCPDRDMSGTFKRWLRSVPVGVPRLLGTLAVFIQRWYYFAMIDWSSCTVIECDPERVSGAWVFRGTRVPVAALFENLEDGALVSQFVEWFPGVTLAQVRTVLEHAARSALAPA